MSTHRGSTCRSFRLVFWLMLKVAKLRSSRGHLKNGGERRETTIGRPFCGILTFQDWKMRFLGILLRGYVFACSAYLFTLWLFAVWCGGCVHRLLSRWFHAGCWERIVTRVLVHKGAHQDCRCFNLSPKPKSSGFRLQQAQVGA